MAGLVPAIHVLLAAKTWMPGIKPGMTQRGDDLLLHRVAVHSASLPLAPLLPVIVLPLTVPV